MGFVLIRPFQGILRFICFALLLVSSSELRALDVAWEGYFRGRGNYYYNLDLHRDRTPQVRAYSDIRFRLNPTFFVTDKIRVRSSLNFFDGPLGSSPLRTRAHSNPTLTNDRYVDPDASKSTIGRPATNSNSFALGGAQAPEGMTDTTDLTPIYLRRVWGEFDFQYGSLKIGRMPVQWGLGIYANAGDDPSQEVGTTRDRILFDTSFGPYYVRPGLGWQVEGNLDQASDDSMEYFFELGRKSETQNIGIYLAYNAQSRSSDTVTGTQGQDLKTGFWSFDFTFEQQFSGFGLGAEILLASGQWASMDLLAVNSLLRVSSPTSAQEIKWIAEAGFSTGTSESEYAAGEIKTYAFSRDYDPALILFEEALPGGAATRDVSDTSTLGSTSPHSGAVSNALFLRLNFTYDAISYFKPSLNIISAIAAKQTAEMRGRWYGIEYDLMTKWPITPAWAATFDFAHFVPGALYERISASHSALLLRAGVIATF